MESQLWETCITFGRSSTWRSILPRELKDLFHIGVCQLLIPADMPIPASPVNFLNHSRRVPTTRKEQEAPRRRSGFARGAVLACVVATDGSDEDHLTTRPIGCFPDLVEFESRGAQTRHDGCTVAKP